MQGMRHGWREGEDPEACAGVASATPFADALTELFGEVKCYFEEAFSQLGVPPPCAKALRCIEGPTSMKDLASRMKVDGSFVTAIADALEERHLARREIDPKDRRVKNLVLTAAGNKVRDRVQELFEQFPGLHKLDPQEREALVSLLHKMAGRD
jgi:DNA-binding MarR family transcriptional regulator